MVLDEKSLLFELATMGLFGGAWSIIGTRLIRDQGTAALARIGYVAGTISILAAMVFISYAFIHY